ncbi:patatin-like phospholipase family protein (macronuclear) [Tetrahymena thermophila SB210]|uniref:Patatin-like phospholipase family protein n=1 Tax=Tetrahymena thermophila (strain SB210) TaxID=312017 RepID=I7MLJ8_TETTS|nr:patatin-like phospholipase family protein [Tetrahymena thermophila SB210]EAS02430.2 patatin-like phospholipase family protein [Tetrahymena thermophila SB210]|eukprot:XP_001022675.2 patatin-like phospholipase family protein [Tetrahymena thermophila SB210]
MHLNKQIKDYSIYSRKEDSILAENYYGYNTKNGKDVFIKIINQKKIPDGSLIRINLENEIIIHQQLKQKNAKNVMALIDVAYTQNNIYLIYQNNKYDTLKNYLNYKQMLSEKECINYFIQIYYGYFESYSQKVKYRDITLNNILIGEEEAIRVDDFGLFKTLFYQKNSSLQYRINEAPETQQDRKSYNREKSDSWSLGILLFQLLFLSEPSFQLGQLVIPSTRIISSQMAQLLFSLLQIDPAKRINWVQILSHDCIKNYILGQKQKQDWNLQLSSFLNPSTANLAERYPQLALTGNFNDQSGQNQAQLQQLTNKNQNQLQQYPTQNSLNYDSLNSSKQIQSNQDMYGSKQNVKYPTLSVQPLFNQSAQFKQPIEHMMPGQGDYNGDCLAANFDQFLITANESILRQSVLSSQREPNQLANKNQQQIQKQQNQNAIDQKYPQMQRQNLAPTNINAPQKEDMNCSQQKYPRFGADVNMNRNQQNLPYHNQQLEQQEQQKQALQYQQYQQQNPQLFQQNTTNSISQNKQNSYSQNMQGMNMSVQNQFIQQQNNLNQQNKYPAMNTNNNINPGNTQQKYPQNINLNNNYNNNTVNQNTRLENNQLNYQTQQQSQLKQQNQIQQQNFTNNQLSQQNYVQNNQNSDQNKVNTQKQQYPQVNMIQQNQQNQQQPQANLNIKGYQQDSTSLNSISTNQSQEWSIIRGQNDQVQSLQQIAQEDEVDDFNLIQDMNDNNLNNKSIFLVKKKQKIDFISKQKKSLKNSIQKSQKSEEAQKVEEKKQNDFIEQQIVQENLRLSITNQNKNPQQQQIVEQMDVSKKIPQQISQNKPVNNIGEQQIDLKQQQQQNQHEPVMQVSRLRADNENQQDEFKSLINDKQIFDTNVRILQEELDKFNVLAQTVERAEDILQAKSNFWVVVSFFILKKLYLIRKELEEQLDAYVKVDESLDRWEVFCLSPEYSKFMEKLRKQNDMIFNSVSSLQKLTIKRLQRLNPQVSNELKKHVPIEDTPNYSANFYVHLHFHIISLQESLSKQMKEAQIELLRHITQLQDCLLIVEQGLFVNNEDFFSIQQHNAIQMTPSLEMLQSYSNQKQEKLQMFLMYYRSMGYDL